MEANGAMNPRTCANCKRSDQLVWVYRIEFVGSLCEDCYKAAASRWTANQQRVRNSVSARLVATTRQLTGRPTWHRAYVLDHSSGRFVCACTHNHRSSRTAEACAERMVRMVLRQARKLAQAPAVTVPAARHPYPSRPQVELV
jgi:recombinational DNA repair protein (RecF pathway)